MAACYVLAATSGLLSLCSRESGLMWMVVFLLFTFGFDRRPTFKGKLIVLAACLALVAAYAGLRQLPGEPARAPSQLLPIAPPPAPF